jgi:hypothetical protein
MRGADVTDQFTPAELLSLAKMIDARGEAKRGARGLGLRAVQYASRGELPRIVFALKFSAAVLERGEPRDVMLAMESGK